MKTALLISVCLLPGLAKADDRDKNEAATTMHVWEYAAEGIYSRCTQAYPEIKKDLQADFDKWKQDDMVAIARANDIWNDMELDSPRSENEIHSEQVELTRLWNAILQQGPQDPANIGKLRCLSYFADYADGVHRSARPEVYKLLQAE
jgi:hypothetical protein